ncbi:MAG: cytochrome c3 family protein [Terriglobales bacterium]
MRSGALAIASLILLTTSVAAQTSVSNDHDMSPGGSSPVRGPVSSACLYCHAPHNSAFAPLPLWNQALSVQTYTNYTSSTYHQEGLQPLVGSPSKLCLSCHDGSVAIGQTFAYGQMTMSGNLRSTSNFGNDLRSSHPFSMKTPLVNAPEMNALLFGSPPRTADTAVQLINGTVECTTCHDPHYQWVDTALPMFLVRDSSKGQLCLACHDPTRVVAGQVNYLGGWAVSAHATSGATTANQPYVGGYSTIAQNACVACHMPHNASGAARLLRGRDEQDCLSCHNGSNTQPASLNVAAEFAKRSHPFPAGNNTHDRAESAVLNNNRHATCVDCHNPHASQPVTTFGDAPLVRASQTSMLGISATDGATVVNPAVNQYENCFRCHGNSSGKAVDTTRYGYFPVPLVAPGDPLNVMLQLSASSTSSHPVTHDRLNSLAAPSSVRTNMLKLDGTTLGRAIGSRIFCSDCHNSDDNRESGGAGPNGPHGSTFTHLLERRYEMTQAPTPGAVVTNPLPNPDFTATGPYALCDKCHDLSSVISSSSPFTRHVSHVRTDGFSCSVCHTSHGMGGTNANVTGERLVDFDINVVAPLGQTPISYNRTAKTCTLTCHGVPHNASKY